MADVHWSAGMGVGALGVGGQIAQWIKWLTYIIYNTFVMYSWGTQFKKRSTIPGECVWLLLYTYQTACFRLNIKYNYKVLQVLTQRVYVMYMYVQL